MSSPRTGGRRCEFSVTVYYYDGEKIKDINCVFDFSPTGRQTEPKWKRKRANYPERDLSAPRFVDLFPDENKPPRSLCFAPTVTIVCSLFQRLIGSWAPV